MESEIRERRAVSQERRCRDPWRGRARVRAGDGKTQVRWWETGVSIGGGVCVYVLLSEQHVHGALIVVERGKGEKYVIDCC